MARRECAGSLKDRTVAALQAALEVAGVIFIDENGEGLGVRLRKIEGAR